MRFFDDPRENTISELISFCSKERARKCVEDYPEVIELNEHWSSTYEETEERVRAFLEKIGFYNTQQINLKVPVMGVIIILAIVLLCMIL